eukprot:2721828-Pyramimonas_sp.AAC.1
MSNGSLLLISRRWLVISISRASRRARPCRRRTSRQRRRCRSGTIGEIRAAGPPWEPRSRSTPLT